MQARCPHCRSVFVTDHGGVQFCPNCGQQLEVPEAAGAAPPPIPPPPGAPPAPEPALGTPWERRDQLGFAPALWATWKETMFRPVAFWRQVAPNAPFGDALLYAWILEAIQLVLSVPFRLLQMSANPFQQLLQSPDLPPQWREVVGQMAGHNVGAISIVAGILVSLLLYPLILIVVAGILHVFCLMFQAGQNGYGATLRVVCYAAAPMVLGFFICLSPLAFIYQVVLAVFGIAAVHLTTSGRASAAVLTPIALSLACCCILPIIGFGALYSLFSTAH